MTKTVETNTKKFRTRPSRRSVLKTAGAVLAAPWIVPASVLGGGGSVAPSERISLGVMGVGGRASFVIPHFMQERDLQLRAVCDCRSKRLAAGKQLVDGIYGNQDCSAYKDFRDMLARPDIDAIYIATGNRWHGLGSILAAKEGKNVYSEKPVTLTIAEGRTLVDITRRYGTVYQGGHQRRSVDSTRFVSEVVREGLIGKVRRIICTMWEGGVVRKMTPCPVPDGFDYDMWLGQTPWHPFSWERVKHWKYFWDSGGGWLEDMGCHWTDLAHFALNLDHTGPIALEGEAVFPTNAASQTPLTAEVRTRYADGLELVLRQAGPSKDRMIRFEGDEGWIAFYDDSGGVKASPESLLTHRAIGSRSYRQTSGHIRNFLDSIKTRAATIDPPEAAHRAMSVAQLANICLRLGRALEWDPATERIRNDDEANQMLSRPLRAPWRV